MTTLAAIGVTVAGGSVVLGACWGLFGLAVSRQSPLIAPRAAARPPSVIHNPRASPGHVQYRGGSPFNPLAWATWCQSLSYETLLQGVPGTGTRHGGLHGTLLHVTLDGIVLLRLHAFGRKVALLATMLCCGLLLPLYATAPCVVPVVVVDDATAAGGVAATADQAGSSSGHPPPTHSSSYWTWYECNATLTTFRQTTLSHVPDLQSHHYESSSHARLSLRLYLAVLVLWIVTWYALYLLQKEWVDLLALRRIHYLDQRTGEKISSLEWRHRLLRRHSRASSSDDDEYNDDANPLSGPDAPSAVAAAAAATAAAAAVAGATVPDGTMDCSSADSAAGAGTTASKAAAHAKEGDPVCDEPHLIRRPPWIPHPEQPDTVPNVEPYSLLVGHLPWPAARPQTRTGSPNQKANGTTTRGIYHHHHDPNHNNGIHLIDSDDFDGMEGGNGVDNNHSSNDAEHEDCADSDGDDNDDDRDDCDADGEGGPLPLFSESLDAGQGPTLTFSELAQYQLEHLAQMLEKALPHEPGYRSPIAAATIVPPSDGTGRCWRRWYAAASALRRHEYLQTVCAQRCSAAAAVQAGDAAENEHDTDNETHWDAHGDEGRAERVLLVAGGLPSPSAGLPSPRSPTSEGPSPASPRSLRDVTEASGPSIPPRVTAARRHHHRPSQYLRQVFGCHPALADATAFDPATDLRADVLGLGPEQLAVYSRELAQSAAPCGPHGFREEAAWTVPLPELRGAVTDAEWRARQAVQDLHRARQSVAERPIAYRIPRRRKRNRRGWQSWPRTGRPPGSARHFDFTRCYRRVKPAPPTTTPGILELIDVSPGAAARLNSGKEGPQVRGSSPSGDRSEANGKPQAATATTSSTTGWGLEEWKAPLRDLRDRNWWMHAGNTWRHFKTFQAYSDELLRRENSYAVLTFTSRQAAAAARQFVSSHRELTLHDIPIPPLADAAPCTLLPCRFFCRPVSVSVTDWQKNVRLYLILAWLGLMYIFYTIPLTFATSQFDPDTISYLFPEHSLVSDSIGVNVPELISGLASSIIWSFFFMMCPQVFKLIAYFGSRSTTLAQAERRAMQYFWWFMVLTAFTGPMLAYWILGAVNKSQKLGDGLRDVLIRVAGSTPTLIAANWLNWIIYRFTIILPINFLLQFNTFLFSFLGFRCCSRLTIGGGPGGPIPYRIFVDSCVVLMCTFALAPSSPLVAPASFAYFCFCEPLLRRNLIFVYRPRYDDGGLRWVSVFNMIISALVVGQILLAIQMGLKNAFGPGFIASLAIPVTIWFQWYCKRKFDPAFENTALLRTSLIDGWESLDNMTLEHREAHLRFLVDAHKAAYVPVCLVGSNAARCITSEPAIAVPHSIIDSDSEHSERPLKSRRPSSQPGGDPLIRDAQASTTMLESSDGIEAIAWLESALEPDELVGAFNRFRLGSQKSE